MESKFKLMNELGLKPVEREVLGRIMEGDSNAEIAATVGITERTVKAHVTALLDAAGCDSRTKLMAQLWDRGWGFKPASVIGDLLPRGQA